MALVNIFSILGLLVLGLAMTQRNLVAGSSSSCNFPAIYNFGDSNSDTGGRSAALTQIPPPYGETNLGSPPKRFSNGHVILNFISFVDPLNYSCGTFVPTFVMCGLSAQVNGTTIHRDACGDPQDRISWDGIHFTDAANSWIASRILTGFMADPPAPISSACP
ncbi:hypothetical protein NL676_025814 [Syzygium grande]|nr:hypothetical protein NL676_025814 [Syzygium grande]